MRFPCFSKIEMKMMELLCWKGKVRKKHVIYLSIYHWWKIKFFKNVFISQKVLKYEMQRFPFPRLVALSRLKNTSLTYYSTKYSGRTHEIMPFRRALAWSCYIIAEGFFILSFFVGYILSFGLVRLRTIRLSARLGAHIERRCSRSRGGGGDNHRCYNKKPRIGNRTGCMNDVMLRSDGLRILGDFWKKKTQLVKRSELIFEPRRG